MNYENAYTMTDGSSNSDIRGGSGGGGATSSNKDGYWHDQEAIKVALYDGNDRLIGTPQYITIKKQPSGSPSFPLVNCTCGTGKDSYNFSTINYKSTPSQCTCSSNNSITYNDSYLSSFSGSYWGMYYSNAQTLKNALVQFNNNGEINGNSVLIKIINDMRPSDYLFGENDYVIIEPVVRVRCKGKYYTGTINSLLQKNVAYFNSNNNKDGVVCNGTNKTDFALFVYSVIGQSFRTSDKGTNAACYNGIGSKVGHGIHTLGYNNNNYAGCGYNLYKIKDLMKSPCSFDGKNYYDDKGSPTTKAGYALACGCKIIDGKYRLKDGTITQSKKTYEDQCLSCASRATMKDPIKRLELYEGYKDTNTIYNQLLNFEKTGVDACKDVENTSFDAGCLKADLKSTTTFDEKNISGYNFTVAMPTGDKTAYCLASYTLTPNISTPNVGTAKLGGMAFIGGGNSRITLATGVLNLKCYLYNPAVGDEKVDIFKSLSYNDFITNITFSAQPLISVSADTVVENKTTTGQYEKIKYVEYEKTIRRTYVVPEAKVVIGDGKVIDTDAVASRTIYGYFSKLSDKGKVNVGFSINLNKNKLITKKSSYSSDSECYYTITGNKYIEPKFRTIDTTNPFIGKNGADANGKGRTVGANWCYQKPDGSWDCSSNNKLVQDVIINSNNSYNVKRASEPLYRITLTPATINTIREYNKTHMLDEFDLVCDSNYNCKSNFFTIIRDSISVGRDKLVP